MTIRHAKPYSVHLQNSPETGGEKPSCLHEQHDFGMCEGTPTLFYLSKEMTYMGVINFSSLTSTSVVSKQCRCSNLHCVT